MVRTWQVQEAKARFSELLDFCQTEGPQIVTKRGAEAAVVVPVAEWRRLQGAGRPTLKEMLLVDHPLGDFDLPQRRLLQSREIEGFN